MRLLDIIFMESFMISEGFMVSKYNGTCKYLKCPHDRKRINMGSQIYYDPSNKSVMHADCYRNFLNDSGHNVDSNTKVASASSKPVLRKKNGRYEVTFNYDPQIVELIKSKKGFMFDKPSKAWWTNDVVVAAKMSEYADPNDTELNNDLAPVLATKKLSRDTGVETKEDSTQNTDKIPSPEGLKYLPYQEAGIRFAMGKDRVLIADEMGLGKTIQAIGYMNVYPEDINKVLIVCPQKLKYNWKKELEKWLIVKKPITVVDKKVNFPSKNEGIIIINYDIIYDVKDKIDAMGEWDLIVVDEAHYIKNKTAKRAVTILGTDPYEAKKKGLSTEEIKKPIQARKALFLTGTPIDNKPQDLFALLNYLDPKRWNNFFGFITKYCGGYKGRYGIEYRQPKDQEMESLQELLRSTLMVRRLKKDVLKDIPPKTRSIITFPLTPEMKKLEEGDREGLENETRELIASIELAKAQDDLGNFNKFVNKLKEKQRIYFEQISRDRVKLGIEKIPFIIQHADKMLKTNDKIIIFAHHREVVEKLHQHFGKKSVMLVGGIAAEEVTDIVDEFQTNPEVKVFIGSILASAEGLTLTAASTVIFGEFDWRPTKIMQAEDRAHRIGQEKNVEIHYLAGEGSLDEHMIRTFIEKARVNDGMLDKEDILDSEDIVFIDQPINPNSDYVTKNLSPDKIRQEAEDPTLTDEVKDACIECLASVKMMDADKAAELNGVGFSKIDVSIGHSLAQQSSLSNKQAVIARRLVIKYRKQIKSYAPEYYKIVEDSYNQSKIKKESIYKKYSSFNMLYENILKK